MDNVQSHDQKENKLNSNIFASSAFHTLIDNKIVKSPFNENNVATEGLIIKVCQTDAMVSEQ